jgi:hypothetical protein
MNNPKFERLIGALIAVFSAGSISLWAAASMFGVTAEALKNADTAHRDPINARFEAAEEDMRRATGN